MLCPRCDTDFQPSRSWQKFCSTKCKMANWNAAHSETQKAKQRAKRATYAASNALNDDGEATVPSTVTQ
jgi:hypothetical protein